MECVPVLATLSVVLLFADRTLGDASAVDQRQRCEDYSFVSLDAVGMSERPCWTVCPPVKSLPMHRKFCQKNCPEYFQDCVTIPNVGRISGTTVGGAEGSMEGHVTLKVFIIVSVVLTAVVLIVVIVAACCVKCCVNKIISSHCKCKHTSAGVTIRAREDHANEEAATLMIRSAEPPSYDHQRDGKVSNLDKQVELGEATTTTTMKRNSLAKIDYSDAHNVTTAAEVHSPDCNSNHAY